LILISCIKKTKSWNINLLFKFILTRKIVDTSIELIYLKYSIEIYAIGKQFTKEFEVKLMKQ